MVRYVLTGVLSLVLGISVTSYYHFTTQTTVQIVHQACAEPVVEASPTGTGEINTEYVPQGRRLAMPGKGGH